MRKAVRVVSGAGLLLALVLSAAPAGAQAVGPCEGSIGGEPAADHRTPGTALAVDADSTVDVAGAAPVAGARYKVELEMAGRRWQVAEGAVTDDVYVGRVKVRDYSRYSVGLFKVIGSVRASGSLACRDAMYVKVEGRNPLTTVAGAAGAAALAGGAAMIASAGLRATRDGVPGARLAGEAGAAGPISPRGVGGGLLAGLGAAVELQQFAVAYLSAGLILACAGGGLAVGMVVPLLFGGRGAPGAPAASAVAMRVPAGGAPTWSAPDPASAASAPLAEGLAVTVIERRGDWVLVRCTNGWSGWTDARLLEPDASASG